MRVDTSPQIIPFFKLPVELRRKIFIYILVSEDGIRQVTSENEENERCIVFSRTSLFSRTLLLNHKFYDEGLPIAYGLNTFNFESLTYLHIFLVKIKDATKHIEKIMVEID